MSRAFRASSVASLLFFSCFQVSAQSAPAVHQPLTSFEQYVLYWTTEPGWRTELQLRNNLDSSGLTVAPAVRTADGAETALPPVTIKSGDVVSVDLYDSLLKAAPQLAGSWGSLVLRYSAAVHRALYAAVMVEAVGRPIAFHLDAFGSRPSYQAGSREGIWWLPRESVTGYLILTNEGGQTLNPNLLLYDSSGKAWQQKLTMGARETKRLEIRSLLQQSGLTGSYGGIRIDMSKGAGQLDSGHLLFDEPGGFSAEMKMFTHDPGATLASRSFGGVKEWTTRAPMLALTNPDPALGFPAGTTLQPKLLVRNASSKTFTAHLRFSWRSGTANGKTAPIDLPFTPNQTQTIDVAALQAQKLLPADAHWAAAILSAPVQPDDLLAIAASYDQTGRYGTQTPFTDQLASHWEAGKWEVDSMHNSLVAVGNGGDKPERAQLTILYNQGRDQYQVEQTLAPDEQMAFDFGKLIRDQVPDKNGHTLPPDLTFGTYRLLDLTDSAAGGLYEGKVILDKTYGHAAYGCMICCGPEFAIMEYDPLAVAASGSAYQVVLASNSCGGGQQDVTDDFPTWWTDNTAIATATSPRINGIAPGTTNHHAKSKEMYWGFREYYQICPQLQVQPTAPTNVVPTITVACSPLDLSLGSTAPASTVTGTCTTKVNPTGGTFAWTSAGGTINLTPSENGSSATYTSTSASTTAGDTTVTVKYTVQQQSASATSGAITVHKPTSLVAGSVTANGTQPCTLACLTNPGNGTCSVTAGTSCTYSANQFEREYKVYDQFGNFFQSVGIDLAAVTENVTLTSNNCGGSGVTTGSSTFTDFFDDFGKCDSCCESGGPGCTTVASQTISVNAFSVRSTTITETCTTTTVNP
jgi:hypothetical protein